MSVAAGCSWAFCIHSSACCARASALLHSFDWRRSMEWRSSAPPAIKDSQMYVQFCCESQTQNNHLIRHTQLLKRKQLIIYLFIEFIYLRNGHTHYAAMALWGKQHSTLLYIMYEEWVHLESLSRTWNHFQANCARTPGLYSLYCT